MKSNIKISNKKNTIRKSRRNTRRNPRRNPRRNTLRRKTVRTKKRTYKKYNNQHGGGRVKNKITTWYTIITKLSKILSYVKVIINEKLLELIYNNRTTLYVIELNIAKFFHGVYNIVLLKYIRMLPRYEPGKPLGPWWWSIRLFSQKIFDLMKMVIPYMYNLKNIMENSKLNLQYKTPLTQQNDRIITIESKIPREPKPIPVNQLPDESREGMTPELTRELSIGTVNSLTVNRCENMEDVLSTLKDILNKIYSLSSSISVIGSEIKRELKKVILDIKENKDAVESLGELGNGMGIKPEKNNTTITELNGVLKPIMNDLDNSITAIENS